MGPAGILILVCSALPQEDALCHPMLLSGTHRWSGAGKSKAAFLGLRVAPSCAVAVANGLPHLSVSSGYPGKISSGAPTYNPWLV